MARLGKSPSLRRLPTYLHILRELKAEGHERISSNTMAALTGLDPVAIRKDIALTGVQGTPRVGYDIDCLIAGIRARLHWDRLHDAILVGVGQLGSTLLGYEGFGNHGLRLVAAFDSCPSKIGQTIRNTPIYPLTRLEEIVWGRGIALGILTVPPEAALRCAERMVMAGIKGIWNFTPVSLSLGPNVAVQQEDLMGGLALLLAQTDLGSDDTPRTAGG